VAPDTITLPGRTGVAPKTRLAPVLALLAGSGSLTQTATGMRWAIGRAAHIIGMSLGANGHTTLWNLPMLLAFATGVLVMTWIGNLRRSTSGGPGATRGSSVPARPVTPPRRGFSSWLP
jgi:hypothetical protein